MTRPATLSLLAQLFAALCVLPGDASPTPPTGPGPDAFNPNAKTSKLLAVDDRLKQRVLARFLAAEGVPPAAVLTRLRRRFGDLAVDVGQEESSKELERRRRLHPHVAERIVIQFLTGERARPIDIHRRLRRAGPRGHHQHLCNVYRWARRFREGRTRVESECAVRARCGRSTTGRPTGVGAAGAAPRGSRGGR